MSRFWAGASSSEEESSDGDSSSDSSGDEGVAGKAGGAGGGGATGGGGGNVNKWAQLSDSDDSDDEVRVVKSGRDRAIDQFQVHIQNIGVAMKEKDYYVIQTEFDELAKAMIKAKQYLAQGVPRVLVKLLCDLEDYIPERAAEKEAFSKLSARQSRSLNRMKLTLNKHNKPYRVVMKAYRANPIVDEDDDDDDDDAADKAKTAGSDDSDDDDSSSSSSDSSAADKKKKKDIAASGSVRTGTVLEMEYMYYRFV
jgi:translation initiation factor 3 subunit C